MKKLKLNKETIALLGKKAQNKLIGGFDTIENLCNVSGQGGCVSYQSCKYSCDQGDDDCNSNSVGDLGCCDRPPK